MRDAASNEDFAELLAAATPTPGGGAAAARVGLLACSLLRMVTGITLQRSPSEPQARELKRVGAAAADLAKQFRRLEDDDVAAFDSFMAALRLPRSTEAEKAQRQSARHAAARQATAVPVATVEAARDLLRLGQELTESSTDGDLGAASDLVASAHFAHSAAIVAELNIDANLPYLPASEAAEVETLRRSLREEIDRMRAAIVGRLGKK